MLIPDFPFIRYSETICFVNPSGLVELRVRKDRIDRTKKLIKYLRRKIGDNTIYKIIPYDNVYVGALNNKSYMIIRHPLQDINEFLRAFDEFYSKYTHTYTTHAKTAIYKFIDDHIELFNNLGFVSKFCKYNPTCYSYIPAHFKSNKIIINQMLKFIEHGRSVYKK
jgi:hypothetical protein